LVLMNNTNLLRPRKSLSPIRTQSSEKQTTLIRILSQMKLMVLHLPLVNQLRRNRNKMLPKRPLLQLNFVV
jgi:hypothetical protein